MCLCPRVVLQTSKTVCYLTNLSPGTFYAPPMKFKAACSIFHIGKVDGQDFIVNLYFFTPQNGISVSQIVAKMEGHV